VGSEITRQYLSVCDDCDIFSWRSLAPKIVKRHKIKAIDEARKFWHDRLVIEFDMTSNELAIKWFQ
jgi:hypothetical protein